MLRSARHGMSLPRRGLVGATAVVVGAVMTITGFATGASATNGPHGWGDKGPQAQSGPWQGAPSQDGYWQGTPQDTSGKASGAYVYRKRDASKPASWENSTQQYLVATWPGGSYRDVTLAQVRTALAAKGIELCGSGWAVQEDQAYGTVSLFSGTPAPSYPTATIGWPPIFAAQHWSLEKFFDVPACGAVAPAPSPTRPTPAAPVVAPTATSSPVATPTPTPTPSTPAATVAPTAQPTVSPTPSVTPSAPAVSAVLAAPDSTQTASPAVVSAVLADEGNGSLAQTGAAPAALGVVAVLLIAAGGVLLVLRRRGAMH